MRRLAGSIALGVALAACGSSPETAGEPYLRDAAYRRAELVGSLVNPDNGYSRLRLASYESGDAHDWARLDEWNPRGEAVRAAELDGGVRADAPLGPGARAIDVSDAAKRGENAGLVALGEEAFFRYPVELARDAEIAAASRDAFTRYGFWSDETRGAGGLVRVEVAGGSRMLAYTCATCHAARRGEDLVIGVGNERLDRGRLAVDAALTVDPATAAQWLAWGPGRLDVTTRDGREPVRIADLRPVRWLTHLQADASIARRDRAALAIRIETLIITSHDATVRPPREIALGLAAYVESLADSVPGAPARGPSAARGEAVFGRACASCHVPPAFTGPPVPLAAVGTDPTIGRSEVRGTGTYRVPSLHGVASRGALLHDASLPGLAEMFDPARVDASFAGGRRGPGPVAGHVFGLELDAGDRADLLAFLGTL